MKHKVYCLVIFFWLLLTIIQIPAYAAATLDGVLGIPWGATAEQVDKAMKEKGYTYQQSYPAPGDSAFVWRVYKGKFAGYDAGVQLGLKHDSFNQAMVSVPNCNKQCRFEEMFREKYGRPDTVTDHDNKRFLLFDTECNKNISDDVFIKLTIWDDPRLVEIIYVNKSLCERLDKQSIQKGKDDI